MVARMCQPNIRLTTQQRADAVSTWRKKHAWAKRLNPYRLLRKHPEMSVADAFERLRDETDVELMRLRERLHAADARNETPTAAEQTPETTKQPTPHRLYRTAYGRLETWERAQLQTLLDDAGAADVAGALMDNPTRCADDLLALANRERTDLEHDWLDTLPADRPVNARPRPVGAFLASLRAHEGQWRMWGTPDTRAMALTAAQELRARAGSAFAIATRVVDEDGRCAVFASWHPKDKGVRP
ncbi:hypothetical protein [Bifidobacterium sp. AGR2158]|uniref:hypothetical protein n=1 Tax=Bifidobacterium sp. AGR2158 TaxID=1280675 RepID=UPI000415DFE6|nr:hypothetical protein [Bifidobacterium sp. AGR2158]